MDWDQAVLPPYAKEAPNTVYPHTRVEHVEDHLFISPDGNLLLNGQQIRHIEFTSRDQYVLCYIEQRDGPERPTKVLASDLLKTAYASGHVQPGQYDAWMKAYVCNRAAVSELLNLYTVTSIISTLPGIKGSEDFLEAIDYAKSTLSRLPTQFDDEDALFAACITLNSLLQTLIEDFERGDLAPCVARIRGGHFFLEAFQQVQNARIQLPLFGTLAIQQNMRTPVTIQPTASVIDKREEYEPLREEILKQIDWQQSLFLALLTASGIFLSLALQPNISGLVAMILPILGLGLALKIAAHDLRAGQINYHLRFVLKSPWEIVRRWLFHGNTISQNERQVLTEQHILTEDTHPKHTLSPLLHDMHMLANRIVFIIIYAAALSIGVIRTYQDVLHHDPLSIFIWLLSFLAAAATLYVLQHRRVR